MASTRDQAPLPEIGAAAASAPDSILGDFTGHRERQVQREIPPDHRSQLDHALDAAYRGPAVAPSSPLATARELVREAAAAARENPQSLSPFTVRLPLELRNAVHRRVIADTETLARTGARGQLPAAGHYVDAALRAIPADPVDAAQWVREWREIHLDQAQSASAPVGSRVRTDTGVAMNLLSKRLKLVAGRVLAQEVHAAAIVRLLDRLDAEDE